MTNATTAGNFLVVTQEVNKLSGGIFGLMWLMALFVLLFVAFKNFGVRSTMPIILYICTLISYFLSIMRLIPDFVVFILIIGTAGTTLASIFINPEG